MDHLKSDRHNRQNKQVVVAGKVGRAIFHGKKYFRRKKALKTNGFQGFEGGDKRDRTADLLNAILYGWKRNEYS